MALKRMDDVGIVVEDLEGTIKFFLDLGLELEGRATIDEEWAGRVTGLGDQHVEIAMMRTPDGHSRLELSRFIELVLSRPIVSARMIAKTAKVTQRGALNLIGGLGVREITGRGRYRAWGVL